MKNEECNFLNIPENDRNELKKMINSQREIDQSIEINIFKELFSQQINFDHRIRKDIPLNEIIEGGKVFLPEELCDGYKDKKICYCWSDQNFNKTIITVFHELCHFGDPFDIGEKNRLKMRSGELEQSDNLQYNIKNLLNEYFAEYKATIILSDHIQFKDIFRKILINSAKLKLWTNANLNPVNLEPNLKLMNRIFSLINPLFHFWGFWRGFQEIGEDSDFRDNWQKRISDVSDKAIIDKKSLNSIKSSLLDNRQEETLVNDLYKIFKRYFSNVLNFQF